MVRKAAKWADADQRASTGSLEARDERCTIGKVPRHGHQIPSVEQSKTGSPEVRRRKGPVRKNETFERTATNR